MSFTHVQAFSKDIGSPLFCSSYCKRNYHIVRGEYSYWGGGGQMMSRREKILVSKINGSKRGWFFSLLLVLLERGVLYNQVERHCMRLLGCGWAIGEKPENGSNRATLHVVLCLSRMYKHFLKILVLPSSIPLIVNGIIILSEVNILTEVEGGRWTKKNKL